MAYPELPLSGLQAAFCDQLGRGSLLLEAEPGAGKSTLAPLWALERLDGEIWLVQPRVLAAVSVARRLAALLQEKPGQTVGYQVPFNRCTDARTRLLVMTPGLLLQRLLGDPELAGTSCVMLDEIHERSLDQDVAWAWLQEAAVFNENLSLVLMSATPDETLRQQVDHSLYSPGRCHPVTVAYHPPRQLHRSRHADIGEQLLQALAAEPDWQAQTVLVFLPGWRAITICENTLQQAFPDVRVYRLHSRVSAGEQAQALDAGQGPRVILATNIAETSLTIADVTLVVDSGLVREANFVQKTGVTRLATRRISGASAEQRRGRAGRVRAGRCLRLWAESEALVPQQLPEIRRCDYLPLALRLAHWGTPATALAWLEAPNPQGLTNARRLLARWAFLGTDGRITDQGRLVASLGTHPRIAALLMHAPAAPGWWLTALALHFDLPLAANLADWLHAAATRYHQDQRWQKMTQRWQRVLKQTVTPAAEPLQLSPEQAVQLAGIMPDRLGYHRAGGRYRLNSGISVSLDNTSDWAWIVNLRRHGSGHTGIGLDIDLTPQQLRQLAEPDSRIEYNNGRRRGWIRHTRFMLGGDCIDDTRQPLPREDTPAAVLEWIRSTGLVDCHWPRSALDLLLRARWAERLGLAALPPLDPASLGARLDDWLAPFLTADTAPDALPFAAGLAFYLGYDTQQLLDANLPTQVTLPAGGQARVDYQDDADTAALLAGETLPVPSISGKLQAFFGAQTVGPQSLPLQIKLLSPAGRPLAITGDLAYFWREVYPQVRRENRGRYAKHPWPEDPLAHAPTRKTKRALNEPR